VFATIGVGACYYSDDAPLRDIRTSRPPSVRAVAGCWRFLEGPQLLSDRMSDTSVLRLDSLPGRMASDELTLRMLPATAGQERLTKLSGWGVEARDSAVIRIWLGDGFSGVTMDVRNRGDSLVGYAHEYTDTDELWSFPHAVVAARRVCPK
jgi:hypothetical protein